MVSFTGEQKLWNESRYIQKRSVCAFSFCLYSPNPTLSMLSDFTLCPSIFHSASCLFLSLCSPFLTVSSPVWFLSRSLHIWHSPQLLTSPPISDHASLSVCDCTPWFLTMSSHFWLCLPNTNHAFHSLTSKISDFPISDCAPYLSTCPPICNSVQHLFLCTPSLTIHLSLSISSSLTVLLN